MSAQDIPKPHGTMLAAMKGIAIASSLLTAGQLGAISTFLPSLYPAAQTSHRLAAQQFKHQYQTLKATGPPAELLTVLMCSGLSYVAYVDNDQGRKWKLWAGAAAAMLSVGPFTLTFMESISKKLLWVSEVASSATTNASSSRRASGISLKVTPAEAGQGAKGQQIAGGGMLGAPPSGKGSGPQGGAITPMEEFEPFEDAVMDEREYEQLKVIKLLKKYNSLNTTRILGPLVAGILGLWASLGE